MYERDESGLRDARENLNDAQDEIAIAKLQEQIDLIQDTIDALNEQKEAIQTAMEESSKYYEKLIKEQEKMFDEMIKKLEDTKKKWEELAAIEELSKSWGLVSEAMAEYGYTVEDVLNDTPGAFEAFKSEYLRILNEMHSGDKGFLEGVKQFGGEVPGEFQKVASSATEAEAPIKKLGDSAGTATGKVSSLGTTASTAASGVGELKEKSEGIADNLDALNNVQLSGVNTALEGVETILDRIIGKIQGAGEEGGMSLSAALASLNDPMVLDSLRIAFTNLSAAIGEVNAALGGGGADQEETYGGAGQHGKNGMPSNIPASGVEGGTGEGLVGAINAVKEATDASIGTGAEEEAGTAIGDFHALGSKIQEIVETKIGLADEEGNSDDPTTLLGAMGALKITVDTKMPGIINWFEKLKSKIEECIKKVQELIDKIAEVEMPEGGEYTGTAVNYRGTAIPHFQGTAKYDGDWGIKKNEKSLVGELGPEIVLRDGHYSIVGKNGPEFVNLKKDDIVLNHLQSREVLSKKNKIGPAHAEGTLPTGFFQLTEDSTIEKLKAKIAEVGLPTIDGIKSALQAQTDSIMSEVRNAVSNNSSAETTVNQHNTFNISGVSGEDVARQINTTLVNTFSGMSLNAYQRSMA